ncbi:hypothetical protein GGI07_004819 [Coemansia sp. Benny D115]|nr:hypothetical protein GGI07_004819 [Coemansia sp. Benny D115]
MKQLSLEQISFYRRHGYLIVEDFLAPLETKEYAHEAQLLVNHCYELGDLVSHWGCIVEPLGCDYLEPREIPPQARTARHAYIAVRSQISSAALALCTLDRFGRCARQLLSSGPAYLLNDQYIVKPPRCESACFAWHQDTMYFSPAEQCHEVVSVWVPLDDVSEDNGTVLVEPFPDPERPGVYEGRERAGVFAAAISAGTALFMDGRLRHCSVANRSPAFRTAYMPQFSLGRIQRLPDSSAGGTERHTAFAVPLSDD